MPVNSFENYPMSWKPQKSQLERPYYLSLASLLEQDINSMAFPVGKAILFISCLTFGAGYPVGDAERKYQTPAPERAGRFSGFEFEHNHTGVQTM